MRFRNRVCDRDRSRGPVLRNFSSIALVRSVSRHQMKLTLNLALLSVIGGSVFLASFYWSFSSIPDGFYQVRDDGVITMSHARNFVDYGFIGINPSGDRVEGFSAPVQFFVYAAAYALGEIGYDDYAKLQTLVATFALGVLFALFFRENRIYAICLTTAGGLLLSQLTSFIEWHGSGMENAVTHVLFLATILILVDFGRRGRVAYPMSIVVFLASVSRLDGMFHVGPLLMVFSIYMMAAQKSRQGIYFSGVVFAMWLTFNLWRYVYFGDVLPNTAHVQDIHALGIVTRLTALLVDFDTLPMGHSSLSAFRIFYKHGGFLLLLTLLLPFLQMGRARSVIGMIRSARVSDASYIIGLISRQREGLALLLIGTVVFSSCAAPFLFGVARLDSTRTTTHLAIASVLGIAILVDMTIRNRYESNTKLSVWSILALTPVGFAVFWIGYVGPYPLCCDVGQFNGIREEFADIARRESLPRPTVANPDLGVMSWHKQFNVVDLGKLGSPILTNASSELTAEYLFEYSAPDIIETHDLWSCHYVDIVHSDARFDSRYQPVRAQVTDWTREHCESNPESLTGIWVRRDVLEDADTPERRLIDDLSEHLSVERLRLELSQCQSASESNCTYVARTAYRFLPEFRDIGEIKALDEVFGASRTREFDLYLINGFRDGKAFLKALDSIERSVVMQDNQQPE